MSIKNQLTALTIRNLDVVQNSVKIMESVDEKFLSSVYRKFPRYIKWVFPDWENELKDLADAREYRFWPCNWHGAVEGKDIYYAYFNLELINDPGLWWLSCFSGIAEGEIGLVFRVNPGHCGMESNQMYGELEEFYQANEVPLKEDNFLYDGEKIYQPFKLDLNAVADAWPNLGETAFQPFMAALENIKSVFNLFDRFVAGVIK